MHVQVCHPCHRHKSLIHLGEWYVRDKCPICTSFPKRTEKQRDFCLKFPLLEQAMHPSLEPDPDHDRAEDSFPGISPSVASAPKQSLYELFFLTYGLLDTLKAF